MLTLYDRTQNAVLPWYSPDAESDFYEFERLPQQKIEVCLLCPLQATDCARCDGQRNLKRERRGRPKIEIDTEQLREMMRLRLCNKEMCAALGVKRDTLIRAKKLIRGGKDNDQEN